MSSLPKGAVSKISPKTVTPQTSKATCDTPELIKFQVINTSAEISPRIHPEILKAKLARESLELGTL